MITAMVRTMPSLTGAAASGTITLDQGRNLSSASINLELKSDILKEVTKLYSRNCSVPLWRKFDFEYISYDKSLTLRIINESSVEKKSSGYLVFSNLCSLDNGHTEMSQRWPTHRRNLFTLLFVILSAEGNTISCSLFSVMVIDPSVM